MVSLAQRRRQSAARAAQRARQRERLLEEILGATRQNGPGVIASMGHRLKLSEAESLCDQLHPELDVQPYDFPGTMGVWTSSGSGGVDYQQIAMNQLFQALGELHEVNPHTVSGFSQLLSFLDDETLGSTPVNKWGTRLHGMIGMHPHSSYIEMVLEHVEKEPKFRRIQRKLQSSDFKNPPKGGWKHHQWIDRAGNPTSYARDRTLELVKRKARERRVRAYSFEGFRTILPELNYNTFHTFPINDWGTTLGRMLKIAYQESPAIAVTDVVNNLPYFHAIRRRNLQPRDFPRPPLNTWRDRDGQLTDTAVETSHDLVVLLAGEQKIEYATADGFAQLLPELLTTRPYRKREINCWGTKALALLKKHKPDEILAALIHRHPAYGAVKAQLQSKALLPHWSPLANAYAKLVA